MSSVGLCAYKSSDFLSWDHTIHFCTSVRVTFTMPRVAPGGGPCGIGSPSIFRSLILLLLLFGATAQSQTQSDFTLDEEGVINGTAKSTIEARQDAKDFYLRIMPLGASITKGSSDAPELKGRGYRKYLRDKLRERGWKVNMVGSQKNGEFNDNVSTWTFLGI